MNEAKKIELQMRSGEIDCNNQELFFSALIKGLMSKLDNDISIRSEKIPHIILNTGDDLVYLSVKGYDHFKEPYEVTNEDYIYGVVPRCVVTPSGISFESDQTSSPYSSGEFQYQNDSGLYTFSAEFRRLPLKLSVDLKYYVSSYTELLELIQQICTKLCWINTYSIVYMGQKIVCSYKIPDQLEGEFLTDLDGTTQDNRNRTLSISLEVESNLPVYAPGTVIYNGHSIKNVGYKITINDTEGCPTDVIGPKKI